MSYFTNFFHTKISNLSVYFPFLAHPNWQQPYFKCWAATCGCRIGQSRSRYRHHGGLKNTTCLLEPSPLRPQGLCGAQLWLNMQLQQTLPLKQGSLPHWSTSEVHLTVSCLRCVGGYACLEEDTGFSEGPNSPPSLSPSSLSLPFPLQEPPTEDNP